MIYGIYINEDEIPFATLIAEGKKEVETRTRDMLGKLVGERVALISTGKNKWPMIVGLATITAKQFVPDHLLDTQEGRKITCIPKGSKYDKYSYSKKAQCYGKWCYVMRWPEAFKPIPLPEDIIRHGRSYCELPGYHKIKED